VTADPLIETATLADLADVKAMLLEYQAWVGVDLCFQNFARELANLPGDYTPPGGALFVARGGDGLIGMIALRRRDDDRAEMKRLFVRPAARGTGLGRRLAERVIVEARARGYREICLDTLPIMQDAQRLYTQLGFRDIDAYYGSPIEGTRYMALAL
jgi:putative acetyltransferase